MLRILTALCMGLLLSACADGQADLDRPPVPLGDFRLGHNIAVASKAQRGPFSRAASEEDLVAAMTRAIDERFGRYAGDKLYHFGISVEGYVLAAPGVPVVAAPKSILIINVTVWDDAAGRKMNEPPEQITVIETLGAGSIVGSGYTLSAEEQLAELSRNAAKAVETFLLRQQAEAGWFGGADGAAPEADTPSYEPLAEAG